MTGNLEHQHEDVFGKSFALYGKPEMQEFVEPFRIRFERNKLDARAVFGGRRCLDAGCGNGRGSIFMMSNGAASVDCVDISESNIESTTRNLRSFGFDAFHAHRSTIERLPFPDETFDVVWCNGVVMHTAKPDACLKELARVLKRGGRAWIYVYGADGFYWWMVRRFRRILAGIEPAPAMASLQLMRYPVRYVAEYMDDWKVPYLRVYSIADFGTRLRELGFADTEPLRYGVDYDSSHRRNTYPDEQPWMGEGDLRYLLTKAERPSGDVHTLKDGEYGSDPNFAPVIERRFGGYFDELGELVAGHPMVALAACAFIQRDLREIMSAPGRLDLDAIEAKVSAAIALARGALGRTG
jgi:SAM-dependent methyltransferase